MVAAYLFSAVHRSAWSIRKSFFDFVEMSFCCLYQPFMQWHQLRFDFWVQYLHRWEDCSSPCRHFHYSVMTKKSVLHRWCSLLFSQTLSEKIQGVLWNLRITVTTPGRMQGVQDGRMQDVKANSVEKIFTNREIEW